jgi:uncharacterized protein (DUF433 family)
VDFNDRITTDAKICGGVPVFRGTRIPLKTVLAGLRAGEESREILAGFPSLTESDVRAAIAFAADGALQKLDRDETSSDGTI